MRIVIRVDSSHKIGSGHLIRCLTLADRLRAKDVEVLFICRENEGHLCELIEQRGFSCRRLLPLISDYDENIISDQESILEVKWQDDANQTIQSISSFGSKIDWLVVDHYALDKKWEDLVSSCIERIMVIDDMANRVHNCNLLLDQNLVANMFSRYKDLVPVTCGMLLGPDYALLQPDYIKMHERTSKRKGEVKRIFICFGGADIENLTGRSLSAFLDLNQTVIEVDVVITTGFPHADVIQKQIEGYNNIHLHCNLPTLAPLLAIADLAIGACGSTSWERLCLGLPTLVVTLGENQRPVAEELNKRCLVHWLGHHNEVNKEIISKALDILIQQGLEEQFSLDCFSIVDGKGADRVSAALTISATTPIRARRATIEDEHLLLEWKNDPVTRKNAFSSEIVSASTHRVWFKKRLNNLDIFLYLKTIYNIYKKTPIENFY